MQYVTGTLTYNNGGNRNSGLTRINDALVGFAVFGVDTDLGNGVTTSGSTTINISLGVDTDDTEYTRQVRKAIVDASVAGTRHISGWVASNVV